MNLKINTNYLIDTTKEQLHELYQNRIQEIFTAWNNRTASGAAAWSGWLKWVDIDHEPMIQKMEAIRDQWLQLGVKHVVCLGIGGSYIGTRAGIEWSKGFFNESGLNLIFVATFSPNYLAALQKKLGSEKFGIVVISKSGTTLEVALGFRLFREQLYHHHPELAAKLIVAVTDKTKGVLRNLVDQNQYHSFVVEDDIGGRFSTLTAVGLFPSVLVGVNVREYLKGAQQAKRDCYHGDLVNNPAALYATVRHFMYTQQKMAMECLATYDPDAMFLLEKAKQLFGESEGKQNKALMPVVLNFTTDLHSVGQLLQEGDKRFFETILRIKKPKFNLVVQLSSFQDDDQLDWLVNKDFGFINQQAFQGTIEAHTKIGHVNNLVLELEDWSLANFGYFYFFLCVATTFSAYLLEVNPFDQPGVEAYKSRMFALLKQ
ncbi:glucose-6-phosphate isomerase [Mycoplasmoides fastidiosum]|uniref:Glucose-6-phosphate isomerase n=1 Tax=Mycoplasmoides fastidiosum TaxID=92758 RepID=A0ABU0LY70_9BACT|nr:glucose-6-phosphate isomerase [Mycoplasmoides fastidiosum]MDQ0513653.1 glucose-6-phosphate isomerase [Mycoplasmoides fastidiosum]UUD37927.1 glucose-6-phosphate isomerase [Mycoplasmoides fastidiosum]